MTGRRHLEPVDFLYCFTLSKNCLSSPVSCLLKVECLLSLAFLIWLLQNCAISCYFFYGNLAKFCFGGLSPLALRFPKSPPFNLLFFHDFVGTLCSGTHGTAKNVSCYLGPISINKYLLRAIFAPMLF